MTHDEIIAGLARMDKHLSETYAEYGVEVVREAADAIAALTRDNKRMVAQLQLAGIGVDTHGALLDASRDLAAQAIAAEAALSSLKREVLEAIAPFSREYARITAEADGFAIWSPQHDGSASVVLNLDRGGFTARVTAGELHRLADLASRLSRGTEP